VEWKSAEYPDKGLALSELLAQEVSREKIEDSFFAFSALSDA
jgi:hypothetical protein